MNHSVQSEILYQTALAVLYAIARDGLPAVLKAHGVDVFQSDRNNAALREDYGDTPYSAPDVVPELGHCGDIPGDAWPMCCTGHSFKESWFGIVCDGDRERGIAGRWVGNDIQPPSQLTEHTADTNAWPTGATK